ncbi:uncharacterized protein LOC106056771 isoform X2 [Biomphalaria glabrata]|uniref:lysophospholipase n=1 Tax=Biomphalaria glabrata TaxID=6526 RepID=A0A9W3BAX8_BIOGL|nr:uncharacterized protein LOC106056771 isoform X2 [Biomphalaria glabrata]
MSTNTSAVTNVQLWVSELTMSIVVSIIVIAVTVLVILFFGVWKYKLKVLPSQTEATKRYRFRKRDKVMFFGRKMLRKVKSFTRNTVGGPGGGMRRKPSHKQMIARIRSAIEETRFLAHRKDPSKPRLKQQSPPQSFLEADWSDINDDHRLPPEVLYMLRSIRVFGHLEKPFFLELCRYMETITLRAGHFLFKIGDPDDSIYVVQNGMLEVYITDVDGTEHLIKQVATGNSIHSLLSILDVLTGHPGSFKSVSARAVTDSTILRLPAHAFKSMFEKFNQSAVKVVQIIMIRLQRVTFSALHNYLGLSKELLKSDVHVDPKDLHIHRINRTGTGSPNMGSPLRHPPNSNIEPTKDEDSICLGITIGTAPKKPLISRPLSESGSQLSDFDAALMRARASVSDDKSIVLSGSPPRKVNFTQPGFSESSPSSSYRSRNIPDEEMILNLALKDLISILGLKDPSLLDCRVKLSFVSSGSLLCKQGDQDTSLFFLVKGTISVLQNVVGESGKEVLMFHAEPGEIIDVLSVLTGEPSFFTMRARTDAIMAIITKQDFYQIMRIEPFIVLNLAHCTVKRMSPFVRQIDFALDWQMLEAGKALFRQGDTSDSIFIVLTGRLRSVITLVGGKKELVNEFGRGELVGIVEVLTQNERATTVLAIRDTELAKIPAELLNLIKLRYPQVVARLIHLLGTSILGNLQQKNTMTLQTSISRESDAYSKMERTTVANLSTIAIVPVTEDVPTTNFALELQHALLTIGPTVRLTPDIVKARLGEAALDSVNEFSLFNWLSQQEDIHRMCLYQCDYQLTKWSKHCLKQADCILIVGLAHKEPTIGPIEKELESIAVRAQKELILLHKEDTESPKNTAEWLNVRGWLSSHHHIRCPKRVLRSKSPAKTLELYEHLFKTEPDRMADFSRLARFLTGTSVGLVLGGGGARGLAHVGMIKAMQEEGIPIDMVGGTSMGAFIGALWAEERNYVRFTQRAREWSVGMTSLWKKIWDLTYPVTSMFTGWAFNESIENVFHDRQIEDLWIPYFCITTNISSSSMRVHSLGSLWRYVRASMSFHPYLPPLCDPNDGHLLLDGAYINNLPADVMHNLGAKFVFAVDVGSQDEKDLTNYGDCLSGWWLLWKRWNPWAKPVRVPDMTEIQSRLAYVSCVRQLEVVKNSDYCEYIRPPIDRYATLQFGSFDEIVETGYHHGKTLFSAWSKGGLQDKLFKDSELLAKQSKAHKERNLAISQIPVMAYFTDLAEQVSKIENPKSTFYLSADSEEEVIDEDDEDPAHMLEGYEEDDEFARSDQDEEISDDETCVKSKVTSIITPLYRLGVISQSSLISLRGTLSDTTELKHPTVRLGKNSADSLNYRMKPHKSSALPAKISKPSFTQEQIDALANDESLLAFLITPWAFSSRGGADDVDQLKSGPSCQADLFKKVNSVATTLKYKPDQVLSDSLLNEADLNWVKSQLFKTNSLRRIQLRKTVSCKDIGSVSRNIHEIDDPEPQVCANISKVRPTGSAESFLEIPNQQVQLATDAEKKVKFSNTPETKIPLYFKSCVNDIHKDVRRGDAPAQQNVNKPCLLIAKDVGTENSHSLQNKDVGLDKPRHHVKDVGTENSHTLQNKDVGLDKPCLFLCKDVGTENSHTLQNKDVGLDKPCLFLCKDVGTENSHTLQNKDVGLDKPCLFLCKDLGSENSHTLQNKDVGLDKPCLFLCKDVGTENSHTLQNKDVGLDKPCLFLCKDVGTENSHTLQNKDVGLDKPCLFLCKDVGTENSHTLQNKDVGLDKPCLFLCKDVGTENSHTLQNKDVGLDKPCLFLCKDVGTENSHTLQNKDVGLDKPCLFLSQDVGIDNFHDLQKKDIGIDTFPVFETKDVGINPVMQSKVICPEAAESFHHLNVNTDLNQMSETEGISVESLGLNKIYICTDSSQVKEMNNASGCILKHPHTLLAFNINSDVSSQHQEVDSISRTAHTFFTPIKETLGQPENVFTDKSPPQSTHVEDRIEKPQAHILDSCKNKSPSKSVELMKKKTSKYFGNIKERSQPQVLDTSKDQCPHLDVDSLIKRFQNKILEDVNDKSQLQILEVTDVKASKANQNVKAMEEQSHPEMIDSVSENTKVIRDSSCLKQSLTAIIHESYMTETSTSEDSLVLFSDLNLKHHEQEFSSYVERQISFSQEKSLQLCLNIASEKNLSEDNNLNTEIIRKRNQPEPWNRNISPVELAACEVVQETSYNGSLTGEIYRSLPTEFKLPEIIIDNYDKTVDLTSPWEENSESISNQLLCQAKSKTSPDAVLAPAHLAPISNDYGHESLDNVWCSPSFGGLPVISRDDYCDPKDEVSCSTISSYHTCDLIGNEKVDMGTSSTLPRNPLSIQRSIKTTKNKTKQSMPKLENSKNKMTKPVKIGSSLSREIITKKTSTSKKKEFKQDKKSNVNSTSESPCLKKLEKFSSLPIDLKNNIAQDSPCVKKSKKKERLKIKTGVSSPDMKPETFTQESSASSEGLSYNLLQTYETKQKLGVSKQNKQSVSKKKLSTTSIKSERGYLLGKSPPVSKLKKKKIMSMEASPASEKSFSSAIASSPYPLSSLSDSPSCTAVLTEPIEIMASPRSKSWKDEILLTDYSKSVEDLGKKGFAKVKRKLSKRKQKQLKIVNFLKRMEGIEMKPKKEVELPKVKSEQLLPLVDHFTKMIDTRSKKALTESSNETKTLPKSGKVPCFVSSASCLLKISPQDIQDRNWMGSKRFLSLRSCCQTKSNRSKSSEKQIRKAFPS